MKIAKFLKQDAVYWGPPTGEAIPINDGQGGLTYADPVDLKVRWSDKQEKYEARNPTTGKVEEHVSQAKIMLDQDVIVGCQIALGTVANLNSSLLPEDNNAYEIMKFSKTPDIRATKFVRNIWL